MNRREMLYQLKSQTEFFEDWNEEVFNQLLELNYDDIENETERSFQVTFLLERIQQYANITSILEDPDLRETVDQDFFYERGIVEKMKDIANLSYEIIISFEEEDILHPVMNTQVNIDFANVILQNFLEDATLILSNNKLLNRQEIFEWLGKVEEATTLAYQTYFINNYLPALEQAFLTNNLKHALELTITDANVERSIGLGLVPITSYSLSKIAELLYHQQTLQTEESILTDLERLDNIYQELKNYQHQYRTEEKN